MPKDLRTLVLITLPFGCIMTMWVVYQLAQSVVNQNADLVMIGIAGVCLAGYIWNHIQVDLFKSLTGLKLPLLSTEVAFVASKIPSVPPDPTKT